MSPRRKFLAIAFAAVLIVAPAVAYDPPPGAETAIALVSPAMMAGGWSVATLESPMGDLANPSASGLLQRTTFDLSYSALVGLGTEPGWGHALNVGIAVPRPYGVWTGALGLLSSPFAATPARRTRVPPPLGLADGQ